MADSVAVGYAVAASGVGSAMQGGRVTVGGGALKTDAAAQWKRSSGSGHRVLAVEHERKEQFENS
jgi:hypothetical protein